MCVVYSLVQFNICSFSRLVSLISGWVGCLLLLLMVVLHTRGVVVDNTYANAACVAAVKGEGRKEGGGWTFVLFYRSGWDSGSFPSCIVFWLVGSCSACHAACVCPAPALDQLIVDGDSDALFRPWAGSTYYPTLPLYTPLPTTPTFTTCTHTTFTTTYHHYLTTTTTTTSPPLLYLPTPPSTTTHTRTHTPHTTYLCTPHTTYTTHTHTLTPPAYTPTLPPHTHIFCGFYSSFCWCCVTVWLPQFIL